MISTKLIRKISDLDPKMREVLLDLIDEVKQMVGETVKRDDFLKFVQQTNENFNMVWAAIHELAEAQKKTEERLNQLAERVDQLAQRVDQLTQRVDQLAQRVDQLAEAQKKTEERLNKLAQRVDQLAEAQIRTEEEVRKLAERMSFVEERLEGISNSVGYGLENETYKYLPGILKRDFNIEVDGRLRRRYLDVGGKRIQINIFGYGRRSDESLMIVGECKVRMSNKELNTFLKRLKKIEAQEGIKVFPIVVAHDFTPEMEDRLKELGITYYWSFELE